MLEGKREREREKRHKGLKPDRMDFVPFMCTHATQTKRMDEHFNFTQNIFLNSHMKEKHFFSKD